MLTVNWSLVGRLPGKPNPQRFDIPAAGAVVGRAGAGGGADIALPSSFISSRHARLAPSGAELKIEDLGSRNGTFVNGKRIAGATLASVGGTVAFADVEFKLESRAPDRDGDAARGATQLIGAEDLEEDWSLSNFKRLMQDRLVTPVLQPVVDLRSERAIGVEALARSNVHGLESPEQMFETAELLNQAAALSSLCREKAVEAARGLQKGHRLFLNTHPQESLARDVLRSIHEIRRKAPALRLVVDVPEDLIGELAATRSFSHRLSQMGVEFALDDFGAGTSRINEVLRLKPAFVKFDRGLISGIDHLSTADQDAIKSLVDLMKSLNIRCVAEGVERREEADVCRRLGFDYAQGFLFGRPTHMDQLSLSDPGFTTEARPQRKETMDYSILCDD